MIEVMIVVAIIGILSAIAYPSYTEYVRRARRADGQAALMAVEAAQARYRVTNPNYAKDLIELGLQSTSPDGYYGISVSTSEATKATSYIATAEAGAASPQYSDTVCRKMTIEFSVNSSVKLPASCWKK